MARPRTMALLGIAGPLLFTTLVIIQGLLQPDYSHIKLPISALAAWPLGWMQVVNFLVTGSLLFGFAIGVHDGVKASPHGALGTRLLALSGVGIVVAGLFSWQMVDGVPQETAPHVVGAVTTFGSTALGLMVVSRRLARDPAWRDLAPWTFLTGAFVAVMFIVLGWFAIPDDAPLHGWAGLLQRVLCAVWFSCLIALAIRLRRVG